METILFCAATFVAAFVSGIAGFAFGLIVMPVWLHLISPLQAAALIALYAMILQGYPMWKLRRAIDIRRLLPLVIGGLVGLPLGIELLRVTPAATMRVVIGVFLVAFSLYSLAKPALTLVRGVAKCRLGLIRGLLPLMSPRCLNTSALRPSRSGLPCR